MCCRLIATSTVLERSNISSIRRIDCSRGSGISVRGLNTLESQRIEDGDSSALHGWIHSCESNEVNYAIKQGDTSPAGSTMHGSTPSSLRYRCRGRTRSSNTPAVCTDCTRVSMKCASSTTWTVRYRCWPRYPRSGGAVVERSAVNRRARRPDTMAPPMNRLSNGSRALRHHSTTGPEIHGASQFSTASAETLDNSSTLSVTSVSRETVR